MLDSANTIVSANDYDAWGYPLENRSFTSGSIEQKYQFTGKERDKESGLGLNDGYDYFGARYYDSRIGRWGQTEPLFDKYVNITPYSYSLCNPIRLIDGNGLSPSDLVAHGSKENREKYFNLLKESAPNLNLSMDESGNITGGKLNSNVISPHEGFIMTAIINPEVVTDIVITDENSYTSQDGSTQPIGSGNYDGSFVGDDGKIHAQQFINLKHTETYAGLAEEKPSKSIAHETVEAYYGGSFYPNTQYGESYTPSHEFTVSILPDKYTVATGQVGKSVYMQRTDDRSKIKKLYDVK